MSFSREEIQDAFDRFAAAAEHGGRTGDWRPWVECFVPDVHYVEHLYGEFWHRAFTVAADTPHCRYNIAVGANVDVTGGPCAVIRHADAGYDRAIDVARERGVRVPMMEG